MSGGAAYTLFQGLAVVVLIACLMIVLRFVEMPPGRWSATFVDSVQTAAESFGMTPACVGFIIVAFVGSASAMPTTFSAARTNRLYLRVGVALGRASQIALRVASMLVLLNYVLGPTRMTLQFWPGHQSLTPPIAIT